MSRRLRIFGVVVPAPGDIAVLADRVRRHYDPNFLRIGPHVTVLPPRPLPLTRQEMGRAITRVAARTRAFPVAFGAIRDFLPVMPVIFARMRRGGSGFEGLHRRLSRGALAGKEPFPFVPHLTLGQVPEPGRFRRALISARRATFHPAFRRIWLADRLLVVERQSPSRWIPLPEILLAHPTRSGKRRIAGRRD